MKEMCFPFHGSVKFTGLSKEFFLKKEKEKGEGTISKHFLTPKVS